MSTTVIPMIGGPAHGQWIQVRPKLPMQVRECRGGFYQLICTIETPGCCDPVTQGQQFWFFVHSAILENFTFDDVLLAYGYNLTQPRWGRAVTAVDFAN